MQRAARIRRQHRLPEAFLARRPLLLLLGLALLLLLGAAGCARLGLGAARAEGPRLVFQERGHDFGSVSSSQGAEHRFAFANSGNRTLELGDLQLEPGGPGG